MKGSYFKAVKSLYGSTLDLPLPKGGEEKIVQPAKPTEEQEQIWAATWLDKAGIPYFHIPNGGYRRKEEAYKLKAMGVKAGVPDICIPLARKGYHGLYIELKRESGGVLSVAQKYWRDIFVREGYAWFEAKGAKELINYVQKYTEK